jgi:hypothetical protein
VYAKSNNGMHPTRDTNDFMFPGWAGGRVMPGVMPLSIVGGRRFSEEF